MNAILHSFYRLPREDDALRGAAEIYARAHAWGHLPMAMEFAAFLAAIQRGDDPFISSAHEFQYLDKE